MKGQEERESKKERWKRLICIWPKEIWKRNFKSKTDLAYIGMQEEQRETWIQFSFLEIIYGHITLKNNILLYMVQSILN